MTMKSLALALEIMLWKVKEEVVEEEETVKEQEEEAVVGEV